jgi:uncharacterized membrane protein
MTEFIFMWLEKTGYAHPIHPPITHIPMGIMFCGAIFLLVAHFFDKPVLRRTALHGYVLALAAIPPTMLLGYMDWQHSYQGVWMTPVVIKIVAALLLIAVTLFNVVQLRKTPPRPWVILMGSLAGVGLAILLGFDGGVIMYGE